MRLVVDCPPKVNLYLRIVRRREDGFHELETVFQSVGGGDTLSGADAAALSLRCSDPSLPVDDGNLVVRAARLLQSACPEAAARGAALDLLKRTPSGAGLGGGSVDAAAALVLLSRLWGLDATLERLADLAAELGSDVPFFLTGGTALARGRGEQLQPLRSPTLWLVLAKPEVSVSTPWAYRQWNPEACGGATVEEFAAVLATGDPEAIAGALRNDLEPGVVAGVPDIARTRDALLQVGALGARMTGSGSAVFAITRDEDHARDVARRVQSSEPDLWVCAVPCLNAHDAALTRRPTAAVR